MRDIEGKNDCDRRWRKCERMSDDERGERWREREERGGVKERERVTVMVREDRAMDRERAMVREERYGGSQGASESERVRERRWEKRDGG